MSALFVLGLALILAFSFSLCTYITCYKIKIQSLPTKLFFITVLGVVVSAATFAISLTIIWPAVM